MVGRSKNGLNQDLHMLCWVKISSEYQRKGGTIRFAYTLNFTTLLAPWINYRTQVSDHLLPERSTRSLVAFGQGVLSAGG